MPQFARTSSTRVLLSARGLTKAFKGFVAVNNVDLDIHQGEIHALIGPNGAGKSTCFGLLTKFITPTSGSIIFDGQDITRTAPEDVARRGMIRSFQISAVFSKLTAMENVRIALQRRLRGDSFDFWRTGRELDTLNDKALALLDELGLGDLAQVPASELSYGRKRALELATTLALDPKMLLLDEPLAGMGKEDIARVAEIIRRAGRVRTVLMVEHNLAVVASLADRITVLARGAVLAEGPYDTVSQDAKVVEAYMGTAHHV